ncbi:RNA-binding protein [Enterovirga aerilata]|uniref:RNA-binding protein n=1 Tax=Enterovirga aerilata TaxID=2730920 RepID=A0A849IBE6_9HYPH|nr:RNA-binding protein [Enterovirga sp. DB1703]
MPKPEPERTCIVTREAKPASELMRFVLGPDGAVVPDLRNRLPGRGAWVTPTAAAVAEAVRKRAFGRAFKAEAKVPPNLVEAIDAALVRDLKGALSLANKAGAVVAGFGKVEAAIASGSVAALIHAREAAEDGRRKLAGALRKRDGDSISGISIFDDLPGDDLDVALGRAHVIHAALLAGPGSEGCLARWRRLRRFRGVDDGAGPSRDVDGRQGEARQAERQD